MNKIYAEQVLIGSRLAKNRTLEPPQHEEEVGRTDRQVSAKEELIKIPQMQFIALEPREYINHRKEVSFSKLSDWQVHKQQSPVLTMANTTKPRHTGVPQSAKAQYRTDITTIVEVAPHSSHQTRRSNRYTNQPAAARKSIEVSTSILVSDDLSRHRMHKVTNSDLDNLIKEVMQSREDPFAHIPAVNMSKNFNTVYQHRNRTISTSSQSRNRSSLKNSSTLDANPQNPFKRVPGNFGSSFPLRRHKRSKSNRCSHAEPVDSYLQTIDCININEMKKVLLKYNNSGLYKERMRAPSACSTIQNPRRSIEKKQMEAVAKGAVGIIGSRIIPIP